MRTIQVTAVRDAVRDMCIEANYSLSQDMCSVFEKARQEEKSPLGRQILNQLSENLEIAQNEDIPICQDTGMAVVFIEAGQDESIHTITGKSSTSSLRIASAPKSSYATISAFFIDFDKSAPAPPTAAK